MTSARNVVLVHGAYADGSSWSALIERLHAAGLRATAVQNPLSSLADDVTHSRQRSDPPGSWVRLGGREFDPLP